MPDVLASIHLIRQVRDPELVGMGEEGGGYFLGHGEAVQLALGQDVPDHDQELPGHRHAGFHLAPPGFELPVDLFPMRMAAGGRSGCLDHGPAQIAAAETDQLPAGARLTALVAAAVQPGIADQLLGGGEAPDIPDRRQNGHGQGVGNSRQLDQQRHTVVRGGDFAQLFVQRVFLSLGEVQGCQVGERHRFFKARHRQVLPERAVLGREDVAFGRPQVMAVQDVVQTGLGFPGQLTHLVALGDQGAQLTHFHRRDPHGRQQAGRVEPGQDASCDLVVHDLGAGDELDVRRVDDGDRVDVRDQGIVHFPGVGRHFDHDGIVRSQMALDPTCEIRPFDLVRAEDLLQFAVHADGHEEMLVDVEPDVALWGRGVFWGVHVNVSFRVGPGAGAGARSTGTKGAGKDPSRAATLHTHSVLGNSLRSLLGFRLRRTSNHKLGECRTMQTVQQAVKHARGLEQWAKPSAGTIRITDRPLRRDPEAAFLFLGEYRIPPPGLPGGESEASHASALFNVQHALNNPVNINDPTGHIECTDPFLSGSEECDEEGGFSDPGDFDPTITIDDLNTPLDDGGEYMEELFEEFQEQYPGATIDDFVIYVLSGEFSGLEKAYGKYPDLEEILAHAALHWLLINEGNMSTNAILNWLWAMQSARERYWDYKDTDVLPKRVTVTLS